MDPLVTTTRLTLREWSDDDAPAALAIYGATQVARWLTPAVERISDLEAMRSALQTWQQQQPGLPPPQGRWAVHRNADKAVIGGVGIRLLPPHAEDLELSWQLNPDEWGKGYAAEAARALIAWAFTQEIDELFAVARPTNVRAVATVEATRHAMGRRDHQVLRVELAGLPNPSQRLVRLTPRRGEARTAR